MNNDDNYKISDHIIFEGYFDGDEHENNHLKQLLIETFSDIFKECGYFNDLRYKKEYLPIEDALKKLTYIIGFQPQVDAWENNFNNEICINLYLLVSLSMLSTFRDIINFLRSNQSISFERCKQYYTEEHLSEKGKVELTQMFEKWNQYSILNECNKIRIIWSLELFNKESESLFITLASKIIFHHEMMHWHLYRFKEDVKDYYIKCASQELIDYISTFSTSNKYLYECLQNYLTNDILALWAEEITADVMSTSSLLNSCNTESETRDIYISLGLFYSLLKVQELYNSKNRIVISYSHPPAYIREQVTKQLLAKTHGYSTDYFDFKIAGSWTLYRTIIDIIIEDYRRL